jgi:hypothetical protein
MKHYDLIKAFNTSTSDKNHKHRYAVVYDCILNSHYLKKGSPLNMLEIGIQAGPSIDVWDKSPIINKVIGVDITTKEWFNEQCKINNTPWNFSDNVTLYHNTDAYSKKFVKSLEEQKFDIIMDDGPHTWESQLTFFNLYYDLLEDGGALICEDIQQAYLPQLQQLGQQYEDFYIFDLRAKRNIHGDEIIAILKK